MNLPEDFTAYTREWMGEDLFADFMKGGNCSYQHSSQPLQMPFLHPHNR